MPICARLISRDVGISARAMKIRDFPSASLSLRNAHPHDGAIIVKRRCRGNAGGVPCVF
jgi:hypothetical protein